MRIRFANGLSFGTGSPYQIQSPLSGLDTPAIRNGSGVYAGADGGYFISQLYGMRTIVIKGFFAGCVSELRRELLDKLYMRYYTPITIEDFSGDFWFTKGYITDIKADITAPNVGQYQITIICPDPAIYPCESILSESPIVIEKALTVNGSTTLLRQGDMDAYPIITLTGEFTAPIITLGSYAFGLDLTTDSSSIITIDMKNRTVRAQDGTSLAEYRLVDSRWLYLGQGANTVSVETSASSDTGTVKLTYSAGHRGI